MRHKANFSETNRLVNYRNIKVLVSLYRNEEIKETPLLLSSLVKSQKLKLHFSKAWMDLIWHFCGLTCVWDKKYKFNLEITRRTVESLFLVVRSGLFEERNLSTIHLVYPNLILPLFCFIKNEKFFNVQKKHRTHLEKQFPYFLPHSVPPYIHTNGSIMSLLYTNSFQIWNHEKKKLPKESFFSSSS